MSKCRKKLLNPLGYPLGLPVNLNKQTFMPDSLVLLKSLALDNVARL